MLIGPETWRAIREHFESECVGPLHLRGKAEPMVAYRVLRPTPRKRGSAGGEWDSLCGRRAELESLRGAFDAALRGGRQLVGVSGEPGVGKTRLFQEFAWRTQPHALVLRGQCLSFGTVAPYQPFRDVLRAALLPPARHALRAGARRGAGARARLRAATCRDCSRCSRSRWTRSRSPRRR